MENIEDCFDEAVHFLDDDTVLAKDPRAAVGIFLVDETEVKLVAAVVAALDRVFEKLGLDQTDEEYISCPEWAEVLATSREAKRKMQPYYTKNGLKLSF